MKAKNFNNTQNAEIPSTGLFAFDDNLIFQAQKRQCPPHSSNLSDKTVERIDYLLEDITEWNVIAQGGAETIFLHEFITDQFNSCMGARKKKLYLQSIPVPHTQYCQMKLEDEATISQHTETCHYFDDGTLIQKSSFFWKYVTKTSFVFPAHNFHIETELVHVRRAGAEPGIVKTLMNIERNGHSEREIVDWLNAVSSSPNGVVELDISEIQPTPNFDDLLAA